MSNPTSGVVADLTTLRRAIEQGEENTLVSLYQDYAELRIVDKTRPPSKPMVLTGKTAIAEYYHDICGRALTHQVEEAVTGSAGLAFTEACRYPDGTRVLSANVLTLRDGKIARHTLVQAWDE
jgi:hypothetical protein